MSVVSRTDADESVSAEASRAALALAFKSYYAAAKHGEKHSYHDAGKPDAFYGLYEFGHVSFALL